VIQASCSRKDELKQLGYTAFKRKDYDEAILLYSRVTPIYSVVDFCKKKHYTLEELIFAFPGSLKSNTKLLYRVLAQYIPKSHASYISTISEILNFENSYCHL
jgi:hypothetical protein